MNRLLTFSVNNEIVFINDCRKLKEFKFLANKKLCIIKTDFKDINKIKEICKTYPNLEVWLACKEISRKNIIAANVCGIKNVIQYPIKDEVVLNLLNKDNLSEIDDENLLKNDDYLEYIKGSKIMAVDDNSFNITLIEETLKSLDLNIETYQKPADAVNAAKKEKYDLFLLDIMMPDISGYELAKLIKETDINANSPIVFVSALSDNENKLKSFNLGSYIYIEKPFNINVFKSQIISLLKEKIEQEKLIKLQETYFSMVTHDMKSPVQAEISALNLLLNNNNNFNEEQREILTDMLSSSKYLQNLVSNVLQKYKLDNKELKIIKTNNSLKNLINNCCEELKYVASDKNITIKVSYKSNYEYLNFDYNEIKRVIHNILSNAINYSYKNSDVFINITNDLKYIFVSVKNCGIGVPNCENVFDKFISYSQSQKSINAGLGLYISKQIVIAHGGNIKFDSVPEQFTEVTFSLPFENNIC